MLLQLGDNVYNLLYIILGHSKVFRLEMKELKSSRLSAIREICIISTGNNFIMVNVNCLDETTEDVLMYKCTKIIMLKENKAVDRVQIEPDKCKLMHTFYYFDVNNKGPIFWRYTRIKTKNLKNIDNEFVEIYYKIYDKKLFMIFRTKQFNDISVLSSDIGLNIMAKGLQKYNRFGYNISIDTFEEIFGWNC